MTLGQLDDFTASDVAGWVEGGVSPNQPGVVLGGGPAGVGDNYLSNVSAGGGGAGSRLAMFNQVQWTGDFSGAGIVAIKMDLNNLGATPLDVRLAFDGTGGGFVTTDSFSLAAGSGWTTAYFTLGAGDFTAVGGGVTSVGTDLSATLAAVDEMRILSSSVPSWLGDPIATTLGVDNIQAVDAVPEPSSFAIALMGAGGLLLVRRRRRQ